MAKKEPDPATLRNVGIIAHIRIEHTVFDAVLIREISEHSPGYRGFLVRNRCDDRVEFLAHYDVPVQPLPVILIYMRRQVRNNQYRVIRIKPNGYFNPRSVFLVDVADQRERQVDPLIILDAAVLVGLKQREAFLLVQRPALEFQSRRIDVCTNDPKATDEVIRADNDQGNRPTAIDVVKTAARPQVAVCSQFPKAGGSCHLNCLGNETDFSLRPAHEILVVLGEVEHAAALTVGQTHPRWLRFGSLFFVLGQSAKWRKDSTHQA